jgi:hypothetical protein
MKYILAAMCALVVLFMGGCTVLALAGGPIALLPAGIAFLNVAILGALFGWQLQWRPAFYILGVLDLAIAVGVSLSTTSAGFGLTPSDAWLLWVIAVIFGLKGILSFIYARQI